MKNITTLTDLDILQLAHRALLNMWGSEHDINDRHRLKYGEDDPIAVNNIRAYRAQIDELHAEIERLRKEEEKRIHEELQKEIAAEMVRLGIS